MIQPTLANSRFPIEDYDVVEFLNCGGFSQIYRVYDRSWNIYAALKVAKDDASVLVKLFTIEARALHALRNTRNSPELLMCGRCNGLIYIVMDLLGDTLRTLKRKRITSGFADVYGFTDLTILGIALQMIDALQAAHNMGFLHRDVKPANMYIGLESKRTIYLADYNSTRQYKTDEGEFRPIRRLAPFRGTPRYASVAAHDRQEQGPKDDLWGLYYSLGDLSSGLLPWHYLKVEFEIADAKRVATVAHIFCRSPPLAKKMTKFAAHLNTLDCRGTPDYAGLKQILLEDLPNNSFPEGTQFDWEN